MKESNIFHDVRISVLDLAAIVEGGNATATFTNTLKLAQHVENLGYHRYWVAEHHNMPGIASSATSVLIGYIAGGTKTIRVGSGGIMLPNHAPLVIAEQFGTLESMYPGRIDLGLGRAPGSDQLTAKALRRDLRNADDFPQQLEELRGYFESNKQNPKSIRAIPGEGLSIPIYLLGSSGFSAQLAARKGLPFAFASHFSPDYTIPAVELYRNHFEPSDVLDHPYVMLGVNIIAAETDEKAEYLATSLYQSFLSLIRGRPGMMKPPVDSMDELWGPFEKMTVDNQLRSSIIGSPETVKRKLEKFIAETGADELIINCPIYDFEDRLNSYTLIKELFLK